MEVRSVNDERLENQHPYQINTGYDGTFVASSAYGSISNANLAQPYEQVKPVNCEEVMHITSFNDLQGYARGTVVRFPDFAEGQPFVARVRRPSLLVLAKSGKIPNSLLTTAGSLFTGADGGMNAKDPKMLGEVHDVCELICEAALIQPTLDDIHNAGLELSDDQLMAIFSYTQTGIKALEPFRKK